MRILYGTCTPITSSLPAGSDGLVRTYSETSRIMSFRQSREGPREAGIPLFDRSSSVYRSGSVFWGVGIVGV